MGKFHKNEFISSFLDSLAWIGEKAWSNVLLPMVYFLVVTQLIGTVIVAVMFSGVILEYWDGSSIVDALKSLGGR